MMNEKENKERYRFQYYTSDIDDLIDKEAESFETNYDDVDFEIKEILYNCIADWMKENTLQDKNINKQVKEKLEKYGDHIDCSDSDDEEEATDIIEMVLTDKKGKAMILEEYKAILRDDYYLCEELLEYEKEDANEMLDADQWFDKHSLLIKVSPKENLEYRNLDFSSVEDIDTAFSDYSDHTTSIEKEKNPWLTIYLNQDYGYPLHETWYLLPEKNMSLAMNDPEFSSLIKEYGHHMNWAEDTYEGPDNDYLSFYIKNLNTKSKTIQCVDYELGPKEKENYSGYLVVKNKETKETYGMTILWYRDGGKIIHREYKSTEVPELHKASEKLLMLLPAPMNSKDAYWRRLCHLHNQKK